MDIKQKLYWLLQAGVSVFCSEDPTNYTPKSAETPAKEDIVPATQRAQAYAVQAKNLKALNKEKEAFNLSSLKKTATHTLVGTGVQKPELMCIIEMPDSEADKAGTSFSGGQGDLLKKMLKAIHLDLEQNAYATYLSPWRTPGNRPLTRAEQALFLPFLEQEIQFVQPKKILIFGIGVAHALLQQDSLSKARGSWHTMNNVPTRVTLALNAIKTTPQRQQAWIDLQEVEKKKI